MSIKYINKMSVFFAVLFTILSCCNAGTNQVTNGSFEINSFPGMADGWGKGGWGLRSIEEINNPEKIRKRFIVDETDNIHGKKSFKIINPINLKPLSLVSSWIRFPRFMVAKKGWCISAYLKLEPAGKVKMELLDSNYIPITRQTFEVSNKWQCYYFNVRIQKSPVVIRITPPAGTICRIDAVQLTKGHKPEKWSAASYDQLLDIAEVKQREFISNVKIDNKMTETVDKVTVEKDWVYVNDKPFFPYSAMMQLQITPAFLHRIKQAGFNTINFYAKNVEQTKRDLDMAYNAGLRAVPWLKCKTATAVKIVKELKKHSALITWLIIDEPRNPFAKEVTERVSALKKADPSRPLWVNYRTCEINLYAEKLLSLPGDIISADWYPVADQNYPAKPCDPAKLIKKMKIELQPTNKPIWFALQLCGYAFMFHREPTPEEFEGMVYSSLIAGSKGLFFFQNIPWNARLMKVAGKIGKEQYILTPVLAYGKPFFVESSNKHISVIGKQYQKNLYIIAVNKSEKSINMKLKIPFRLSDKTKAEMLFEERYVKINEDNKLEVSFDGFQRHVIHIKLP